MMDAINAVNDHALVSSDGLSMVDVYLQPLLRQHLPYKEGGEEFTVVSKSALIAAVRDYVNAREMQFLNERAAYAKNQEERMLNVEASYAALKVEKDEAVEKAELLSSRLDSLQDELQMVVKESDTLRRLNLQLENVNSETQSENEALRQHLVNIGKVGEVAAEAMKLASLKREEDWNKRERQREESEGEEKGNGVELEIGDSELVAAALQQQALTEMIQVALESLEIQRIKGVGMADKVEEQLAEAISDMEERETHIHWLQTSLAELLRRKAQTERFVEEELRNEMQGQMDVLEMSSHAELEASLEAERKRYAEKADQLEKQLEAVRLEKETASGHVQQLEEALEKWELQAAETQMSAEKLQTAIMLTPSSPLSPFRDDRFGDLDLPRISSSNSLNERFQVILSYSNHDTDI